MNNSKLALGVLAGFAIGALTGILLAPAKGSTTRKHIKDMGEEYVNQLKSKLDDHVETIVEKYNSIKENTEEMISAGKAKYEDAKKGIKTVASDLKQLSA